jgi:hypothetical protein
MLQSVALAATTGHTQIPTPFQARLPFELCRHNTSADDVSNASTPAGAPGMGVAASIKGRPSGRLSCLGMIGLDRQPFNGSSPYENTPVAPRRKNGKYAPITFLPSLMKAAQESAQFLHCA